jgi:O-antigen ligase
VNWNIAKERPFTGAGFNLEYVPDALWLSYTEIRVRDGDPEVNVARAAHSSYFQIVGQHGFIALGLFVLLLALTIARLQMLKSRTEKMPGREWIGHYASGLQIGLIGFVVSGAFINGAYFDLLWIYVVMTAVLYREYQWALVEAQGAPAKPQGAAPAQSAAARPPPPLPVTRRAP